MACHQEACLQRLCAAFSSAFSVTEALDDGRCSYKLMKNIAEAIRVMLAATMWIMRMAGDDLHSHYDVSLFFQLTANPILTASIHAAFNARRHIEQPVAVVADRMGKTSMTLGEQPACMPDWASGGVKFFHDASPKTNADAHRWEWLGIGPPEDDNDKDDDKNVGQRGC
eukprot:TRINITY_DN3889_c0_g1_i1.p1 TRINITY_DN3889_c0_g1~~TRINITY_DN3889_c0_g1_i1.p1  ORF type:complete len:169 (-),score=11.78 TRINITY_DN3889_c0_g1_i1:74-580(-)